MPTYEYICPDGYKFEIRQSDYAEVVVRCPICHAKAKRLMSIVNHKQLI